MANNPRSGPMGGGHAKIVEKPRDFKGSIAKLIRYIRPFYPVILIALILAMFGTILALIGPNQIGDMTTLIQEGLMQPGLNMEKIQSIAIFLVVIYAFSGVFAYIQSYIMATVTQRITYRLRKDITTKINHMPLNYFDTHTYGDILSRVTNDVDTIGQTLNQSIGTLVSAGTMVIGSAFMMFVTHGLLAIVAIVATLIGFVLMIFIMKHSQKYFFRQQVNLGKMNGYIEEMYAGHTILRAYNAGDEAKEGFNELNKLLFDSAWRSQFFSGLMMPIMQFISNLGYVSVCIVGAILYFEKQIDFGVIISFIMYVRLFSNPLSQLAQVANNLQSAAAASERVFEFLEETEVSDESCKTEVLKDIKGEVVFDHVHFGYTIDREIIHDFSMKAEPGQKIAIVGPTGAGKTTLVNLLMRFYEVNQGDIRIDGQSIQKVKREDVRDTFCMVLQDSWLFEGTIKENIVYSKQGVSDEDVKKVCKIVGLHHFVRTLPKGYDTILDDKSSLSQGQKQLITIARAMIENAPLLILDEATSSVDTRTEVLIQEAMDRLTEGRTSFVIAHRLSTIKNADVILVLKDGDVVEMGNHDTLMAKAGFYKDLYNSQFEQA